MTPLVTIKTRTMIVFRWGGCSQWLKNEHAQVVIEKDRAKHRERRIIAYIVRCRPRTRR